MSESHPSHPIAEVFPLMTGTPFEELVADIAGHGLREPITLHPDGSILDGRNRDRACVEANVEPRFETWDGQGSVVDFSILFAMLVYAIIAMIVHAVIDWLDVKIRQWAREAETARMRSAQSPPPSA